MVIRRVSVGGAMMLFLAGVSLFACGDDGQNPGGPATNDGGADGDVPDGSLANQPTKLSRASRGSGLDISEDDTILVAANRDVGTVSVFSIAYAAGAPPVLTKTAELQACAEPWQVVLAPNGDRAFVTCRKDQKVVRLENLRSTPAKGAEVAVGSEPIGIALTPKATSAWVANWVDGTLSEINTDTMTVSSTVDLNAALVATNALGAVAARPALAHPRSVVITNNKDDVENDESLFVTEYFAQQKETLQANGSNADVAKQGMVYKISLKDKAPSVINLPPIQDIGITDVAGGTAGCYPNQVQAIDSQGSFAYVLSVCASPKGPLGDFSGPAKAACTTDPQCPGGGAGSCDTGTGLCKTNCTAPTDCGQGGVCTNNVCELNLWNAKTFQTPAVSVIDIGASKVIASVAMNGEMDKLYAAKGVPDTTARRMPANSVDLAFVPGTLNAYVASKAADAVFRLDFNATYETKALDSIGFANKQFIQLDLGSLPANKQGKLPVAIAMGHKAKADSPQRFAFVLNEATRNVTTLDLTVDDIAGLPDAPAVVASADMPTDATETARLEGKRLFGTGLGRWSFQGQAWGACETCHVDGLSDQITWFHLRGPRQTPSLDQTVSKKDPSDIRIQNWQANADEIQDHEMGALRVTLGGVGAAAKSFDLTLGARIAVDKNGHAGLNGSMAAAVDPMSSSAQVTDVCVLDDWQKIVTFIKGIRSPQKPSNLDAAKVAEGQALFTQAKCQGCHGGDKWTISKVFYAPDANVSSPTNENATLKTKTWSTAVTNAGFPAALLPTNTPADQTMRYSGPNPGGLDQLTCILRPVGTYNVAEPNVGIAERKRDMTAPAQGNEATGRGFNPPSLIGMSVNAPYFHAGQARTLEAVLADPFSAHHAALSAGFLGDTAAAAKRAALVQFLLSIDSSTAPITIPALGPDGGNFCTP